MLALPGIAQHVPWESRHEEFTKVCPRATLRIARTLQSLCWQVLHRTCGAGHFNSHLAFGLHLQVHRLLSALDCLQVLCISALDCLRVLCISALDCLYSFAAVELCRGTLTESSPLDEPGFSNQ